MVNPNRVGSQTGDISTVEWPIIVEGRCNDNQLANLAN